MDTKLVLMATPWLLDNTAYLSLKIWRRQGQSGHTKDELWPNRGSALARRLLCVFT